VPWSEGLEKQATDKSVHLLNLFILLKKSAILYLKVKVPDTGPSEP
jgi:hypothetical protein